MIVPSTALPNFHNPSQNNRKNNNNNKNKNNNKNNHKTGKSMHPKPF
jgi:hypothetical protein